MKSRKLTLLCSIGLVLVLVLSTILAACAQEAAPAAPAAPAKPSPTTPTTPTTPATPAKPAPAPAAEVHKWKFTTTEPEGTDRWHLFEVFAANLEEQSQGRIVLSLYPTGQLVKGVDMLEALEQDVIQVGDCYGPYWSEFIPETAVEGGFPFTLRTIREYNYVWYELGLLDLVREVYAEHGTYYLAPNAGSGAYMWASKPIVNLADFEGLKARGTGLRAQLLEQLGVATTYIPHEEGYMALQLGTVTAYETALATYMGMKHYEVCPYVMTPGLLDPAISGGTVISTKARDKLPADLQLLLEASGPGISLLYDYIDYESQAKILSNLPNYGAQTVQFSAEVVARMTEIGTELMEEYGAKSARCQEMVDIIKGYMKVKGYIE
ncbi:TRAP transporter substrate-binding protein DctP [Chloroflexota bacterium]